MNGNNILGNSRHPNSVGSDESQEPVLGARFKVRAGDRNKNAVLNPDAILQRDAICKGNQVFAVRLGHIRKPWSERIIVRSDKRIIPQQINVVGDNHDATFTELRIHSARRV